MKGRGRDSPPLLVVELGNAILFDPEHHHVCKVLTLIMSGCSQTAQNRFTHFTMVTGTLPFGTFSLNRHRPAWRKLLSQRLKFEVNHPESGHLAAYA